MATNLVYRNTDALNRVWDLGATFAPGLPVKSLQGQPGVTVTGTGNYTKSQVSGPYTISGIPAGGIGLGATEATVATDGTWNFTVTGGLTTTPNNTAVYITSGNALTLTASGNSLYGVVDYPKDYIKVAGILPVKIGKF